MGNKYLFIIFAIILISCVSNKKQDNNNHYGDDDTDNVYSYFTEDWFEIDGDTYFYNELWVELDENGIIAMTGRNKIFIKIIQNNNNIKFFFIKDKVYYEELTTVTTIIDEAIAEGVDGKYQFQFIDSWENKIFGYIIFNDNDTITFYLDCNDYSEYWRQTDLILTELGREMGVFYGGTYILTRGTFDDYDYD
jgi:hypothetical protein